MENQNYVQTNTGKWILKTKMQLTEGHSTSDSHEKDRESAEQKNNKTKQIQNKKQKKSMEPKPTRRHAFKHRGKQYASAHREGIT